MLTEEKKERYKRQIKIPEIGISGQEKLANASMLIVGCGGLGSASSLYLGAAGVGSMGLVDADVVELSNLQRQILHNMESIGLPKVESGMKRLKAINPDVKLKTFPVRINQENIDHIAKPYSIIIDASDNFQTRYLLNDYCVATHKPFIYGAVFQFSGQISVFDADNGPCFRCVFKRFPNENHDQENSGVGVISPLPGLIGCLQAVEAVKYCLSIGTILRGRLLLYDGLDGTFREVMIQKKENCPTCA